MAPSLPRSFDRIIQNFKQELALCGFDICHAFDTRLYNQAISGTRALPLICPTGSSNVSLLIGNTRNLWPVFTNFLSMDGIKKDWLVGRKDPLDDYTVACIQDLVGNHFGTCPTVHYSHLSYPSFDRDKGHLRYLSMQTMAHVSGLATFHPASHLCIHPKFGPWIGLRGVVTLHDTTAILDGPSMVDIKLRSDDQEYVETAAKQAKSWQDFLGIREFISQTNPQWEQAKYTRNQIIYHYTKNRSFLHNSPLETS